MNNNRIWFYDNLKFILITLVVIGHFLIYRLGNDFSMGTFLFIYSFHMPLFVFVTGFFSKKIVNADTNKRLNKILSYFIIYLIYKIILFILFNYVFDERYEFNVFTEGEAPWYLFGCALWIIMTNLFKNVKAKYVLVLAMVCAVFFGYDSNIADQFCLSRVFTFYPFYLLGYYATKERMQKIIEFLHSKKVYVIVSLILLLGIYSLFVVFADDLYFLRPFFTSRNPFRAISFPIDILFTGALFRMLWLLYTIIIGVLIIALVPNRKTIYSNFGSRTIQVYVLHFAIVLFVMHEPVINVLCDFFGSYVYFVLIILGILLSVVLSLKWFETPFKKILNLNFERIYFK